MKQPSFQEILRGFLEEDQPNSPRESSENPAWQAKIAPEFTSWFHFSPPPAIKKNGYPARQNLPPQREKSRPAEEPSVSLMALSATDRADIERLLRLGAQELAEKISMVRLKKAYRRLVKTLHPDRLVGMDAAQAETRVAQFRILQASYERLARALPAYFKINDSTCGNESASGSNSPRRDAA